MKKLLKLPLRIATLPLIAILLVFQLISSLIVGLTSIVTNLLATVFLIGSVAGWIANAPSGLIFQTAGIGIFFAVAPHIAGWGYLPPVWVVPVPMTDSSGSSICTSELPDVLIYTFTPGKISEMAS